MSSLIPTLTKKKEVDAIIRDTIDEVLVLRFGRASDAVCLQLDDVDCGSHQMDWCVLQKTGFHRRGGGHLSRSHERQADRDLPFASRTRTEVPTLIQEHLEVEMQKVGISQGLLSASLELGVSSATTSLSLGTRIWYVAIQRSDPAMSRIY